MTTRAAVAVLALSAVAMVLIGCGGDDDDERAGPTTTIDVEVDDTTTTTEPATTTTLSEADRFRSLAVELWTARNDLYQNPPADPEAALAEIFDRQCDCFQAELDDLADLAARGLRMDGPPALPLGVRFSDVDPTVGIAGAQLALDASNRNVLGAGGAVVEELTGGDPVAVTLLMNDHEGRWVIDSLALLDVDDAFVDELIAEGLP